MPAVWPTSFRTVWPRPPMRRRPFRSIDDCWQASPIESVVFVSIGPLTNMAALLDSPAGRASDLTGRALVEKKVRTWVAMGGTFPAGREFNFYVDAPATSRAVDGWPTPIVFSGFEIGQGDRNRCRAARLTGHQPSSPRLRTVQRPDQPTKLGPNRRPLRRPRIGRPSSTTMWDLSPSGSVTVSADGGQSMAGRRPIAAHRYLIAKMPPADVARAIEALMAQPPRR